ncbi:MAG: laminin G domain-containing protein [Verrucomicrobiales bacterium]
MQPDKRLSTYRLLIVAALLPWGAARAQTPEQTIAPEAYSLPRRDAVAAELEEGKVVLRGRVSKGEPYVVEMGRLEVEPNTTYRGSYPLAVGELVGDASLYLMIREHEAMDTGPFPDYNKTPPHQRSVTGDEERSLQFVTGEKTGALSVALVVAELDGALRLGPFTLRDVEREIWEEHEAVLTEVRAAAAAREQRLPRTLVFSRAQMKYGLHRNYEHVWTDRPLFVNRGHRVASKYVMPPPSYARMLEEVVEYDIDGLAFFPETTRRMGIYELTDELNVPGVSLLTEFLPMPEIEPKMAALEAALECENAARIEGKILITSYSAEALELEEWDEILTALREKHGDVFVFLPALTHTVRLRRGFNAGDPVTREDVEECQAYLRRYLDVCDGIYFNYAAAFKLDDHTFDEAFYRELFIPVFKSVLSEPPYRDKYLGLSAYHSHHNPDLAIGLSEDGTRTLRDSFEAAMEAKPDVILCPEWDEVNENTNFRPTTCNSTTTKRILRYYMSRIRDKAATPLPGDDASVPNLIVSTRKIVTLGETLVVELLNVPDDVESHPYSVELSLEDESGRTVRAFEPVTFDSSAMQEKRYEVPTEAFPSTRALVPVVEVRGYKDEDYRLRVEHGLPHAQIRTSWNWDFKFVKQPLRELLPVSEATLAWSGEGAASPGAAGDGLPVTRLAGAVEAEQELALVEVVADGDVVHAVSPTDELLRASDAYEMIRIEYRSTRTRTGVEGSIALHGADAHWLSNQPVLHKDPATHEPRGGTENYRVPVSPHLRWICLAIPREQLAEARLEVRLGDVAIDTSASEVLDKQMIAAAGEGGLHVAVFPYRRTLDMPFHLERKTATFDEPVWPWLATEQYHLRLTGTDGRTYRTRPLMQPGTGARATKALRIWSGTDRRAMDVRVSEERVPDVRYDFDPSRGAALLTEAGRPFHASIGGFPDTTSGRGGRHSASMFQGDRNGYPDNAERTAPEWVESEGGPALRFDGVGTFVHLPREALPRRGSFTLSFGIKPEVDKNAHLFLARTHRSSSLELGIEDGKLRASYFGKGLNMQRVETDLDVPVGEWSTIRVSYDLESMTLSVGDRTFEGDVTGPGFDFSPIVFGGFGATDATFDPGTGNTGWFKGLMRGLRIEHNAP